MTEGRDSKWSYRVGMTMFILSVIGAGIALGAFLWVIAAIAARVIASL